ncbi:ATP-binding cassette domain-containing protein [Candidatus Beckwithbacteria bacterium]|nr:ATP-binding cassette domain-containing protein [Candidatus Beckwithbacteria bacterium]
MSLISFRNVSVKFKSGIEALKNVSFEIEKGEFVFLVGVSGSGKTTMLRLLLREILPNEGQIFFDEEEISKKRGINIVKLRRKIGTSFQDVKLLMDRTIEENIAVCLDIYNKKKQEAKAEIDSVLDLVDLSDKREMFPAQLSGGEMQRVGIARAVVGDPMIIFADEPTANLDEEASWQIASLLKEINRTGKTVIVATHNVDLVDSMKQRVLHLDKGVLTQDTKDGTYHK